MSKKKNYGSPKLYQCPQDGSTHFIQTYDGLVQHPAFTSLSPRAQNLYDRCVRETHGQATEEHTEFKEYGSSKDTRLFYMNRDRYIEKWGLYKPNCDRQFREHMTELIEHGFVDCVVPGANTRTKNVYRLSARYLQWDEENPPAVPWDCMTKHMRNKQPKEEQAE